MKKRRYGNPYLNKGKAKPRGKPFPKRGEDPEFDRLRDERFQKNIIDTGAYKTANLSRRRRTKVKDIKAIWADVRDARDNDTYLGVSLKGNVRKGD